MAKYFIAFAIPGTLTFIRANYARSDREQAIDAPWDAGLVGLGALTKVPHRKNNSYKEGERPAQLRWDQLYDADGSGIKDPHRVLELFRHLRSQGWWVDEAAFRDRHLSDLSKVNRCTSI